MNILRHHLNERKILTAILAGKSYKEIMATCNCCGMTISRIKHRCGMTVGKKARMGTLELFTVGDLFRHMQAQKQPVPTKTDIQNQIVEIMEHYVRNRRDPFLTSEIREHLAAVLPIKTPREVNELIALARDKKWIEHDGWRQVNGKTESVWRPRAAA